MQIGNNQQTDCLQIAKQPSKFIEFHGRLRGLPEEALSAWQLGWSGLDLHHEERHSWNRYGIVIPEATTEKDENGKTTDYYAELRHPNLIIKFIYN